jgi:3-oxosteroid 1-dehydrogenase
LKAKQSFCCEFDVIVVGSGAGGMTAALVAHDLGLKPLVIEKSSLIGGTTAVSGGAVWIPNNPKMQALGTPDSLQEALVYLQETVGEYYDDDKARSYVTSGVELVEYLEKHSHVAFRPGPLPDYYSGRAGGKIRHRALDPLPISARALGEDIRLLRPPHPATTVAGVTFTTGEVGTILRKDKGWFSLALRLALRHFLDLRWHLTHRSAPRLTLGNALVARCLLSLKDRKVPLWRETSLVDLVVEDGVVTGILAKRDGQQLRIAARHGVVIAAGGFSSNPVLRQRFLTRCPDIDRSVAPDVNTGEGILAGERVGAGFELMDEAWWIPVYRLCASQLTCGMFFDRAFPGSLIVNAEGRRFMNEAANYDEAGRAMSNAVSPGDSEAAAYMIFDTRYRSNYIAGPLKPGPAVTDIFLSSEVRDVVTKASTLPLLAGKLGINTEALLDTVERFNEYARKGRDPEFGRGEEAYERHYSDPKVGPNSTMAPLTEGPYYAIRVLTGDIGTKGGLKTDEHARVLTDVGTVIPGLYAIGSSAASMMGKTYPAGGVTIGPSMVFGAQAAMHMAGARIKA